MRAIVCIAALAVACLAVEMTPSQTEATFTSLATSIPQLLAQEQLNRKYADLILGLQISSQFYQLGLSEYQKYNGHARNLEQEIDEDDNNDDVSLLELKEQFVGALGGSAGLSSLGLAGMTAFSQSEQQAPAPGQAKFSALKALQIQFYLASSDVETSYWTNKVLSSLLPPQLTIFKLYKGYLNTMALSIAYQFQDSFNLEAVIENFNNNLDSSHSTHTAEAYAELSLYTQWSSLATIKYQLFLLNLYEKFSLQQFAAQMQSAQQTAYGATSFMEVEVDSNPFVSPNNPNFLAMQYTYLSYYSLYLRFSAITSEVQLAQLGYQTANSKILLLKGQSKAVDQTANLEQKILPQAYIQWSSLSYQRYQLDYFVLIMDMYAPGIAASQAADRAENIFQNLVQTEQPITTETEAEKKSR